MEESFPLTVVFKKHEGELVVDTKLGVMKLEAFLKELPEGAKVEVTYEVKHSKVSYAQLSKLHKCIRIVASHTGHTFDEIKSIVKIKAGLYTHADRVESFAELSKEEMSKVIQTVIELGASMGINLEG